MVTRIAALTLVALTASAAAAKDIYVSLETGKNKKTLMTF